MNRGESRYTEEEFFILKEIFFGKLSRNKNYELFLQPRMRELHRRAIYLRGLGEFLAKNRGNFWSEQRGDSVVIQLVKPELDFDAVIFLSIEEWELIAPK